MGFASHKPKPSEKYAKPGDRLRDRLDAVRVAVWISHGHHHEWPVGMQRAKLKSLGLESLVDIVVVSGEEGMHKPAAELFHRAAERLCVDPSRCLYVGDNPVNDVGGAIGAGMHAIWLRTDMSWPDETPRPPHSIRSLGALVRVLQQPR